MSLKPNRTKLSGDESRYMSALGAIAREISRYDKSNDSTYSNNNLGVLVFSIESIVKDALHIEPLSPCPNPECGADCEIFDGFDDIFVVCPKCYYRSPEARSEAEAKRLHNLLSRKGIPDEVSK